MNLTTKSGIEKMTDLKDKRFSFFADPQEERTRNAIAHLHICLPAHAQSRHKKAAKRAKFAYAHCFLLFVTFFKISRIHFMEFY